MEGARRDALTPENIPIPDEPQEGHLKGRILAKTTEDVQGPYASRRQGTAQGSKERAQSERGRKLELDFGEKRNKEKGAATASEEENHCLACHSMVRGSYNHTYKGDCEDFRGKLKVCQAAGHCLACHAGAHSAHLKTGDCRKAPQQIVTPAAEETLEEALEAQLPQSFKSLEDTPSQKTTGSWNVVTPEVQVNGTPEGRVSISLEEVLEAVKDLKEEVRTSRTELKMDIIKVQNDQKVYEEKLGSLETSLTNLQVQHSDVATELRGMKQRMEQLEGECATRDQRETYWEDEDGGYYEQYEAPSTSQVGTPRQIQDPVLESEKGEAGEGLLETRNAVSGYGQAEPTWSDERNKHSMAGPPSPRLEHSNFMSQELSSTQLRENGPWVQEMPAWHREPCPLQSPVTPVGITTGQADRELYRVPTRVEELRGGVDAKIVAYHVPQEMQRTRLPSGGVMKDQEEVETGQTRRPPRIDSSQGHAWSPSRGEPGMQARAQGTNFGVGGSSQLGGSGESSRFRNLQHPSPLKEAEYDTYSFRGERLSPMGGVANPPGAGQIIHHIPVFPGMNGARKTKSPPGLEELDEELSVGELNLLIKFLQSMGSLPRIEVGEPHNRGERLTLWRLAMETQLKTTRRVVVDWWRWSNSCAEQHYKTWLRTPIMERNQLKLTPDTLPRRRESIEDWFLLNIGNSANKAERLSDARKGVWH